MVSATRSLPHWDMTVIYPGIASPELARGFADLVARLDDLTALFDAHGVALREPAPLDDATVRSFDEVVARLNTALDATETITSYVYAFVTTDSRDDAAQARLSELQQQMVRLSQLGTRFTAWIGSLDVDTLLEWSETARAHRFALETAKRQAAHLMSPPEEDLAAEMDLTGGAAWGKLHGNVTSRLMVPVEIEGETRELPMSAVRNLAYEEDRELRRRAYEAELAAWKRVDVPLAAALNSIKGQVNTLSRRRGWASPLDVALFDNRIDRETLDAMLGEARAAFPDYRRYLKAKARVLGLPALTWYDLFAPVGSSNRVWEYDEAAAFIAEQFGDYSPRLRGLAERAFGENWIDAEPHEGKEGGAFCMPLRGDESRVLTNYTPAFDGVSTLAHELGHAYHNLNLAGRTQLQRQTPMALAETASIFCETIITQAGLRQTDEQGQLALLQSSLQGSCGVVVDISSRFIFESAVFDDRRGHELSVDDFNRLMLDAQRETYGDGLDHDVLHPYMWAVKSHYYSSGYSFYNFPYMFGLLFGLGLYARYEQDPEEFKRGYDDLLSSTGLDDAATLASRFGIDVRTPDFWRASFDVIRRDVDRFEQLAARHAG